MQKHTSIAIEQEIYDEIHARGMTLAGALRAYIVSLKEKENNSEEIRDLIKGNIALQKKLTEQAIRIHELEREKI